MTTQTPEPKKVLPRIFIADSREFSDPDPSLSVEEVTSLLSDFMPEIHNCEIKQTEKDGKLYIQFIKKVGVKG
jgi:PRTRC genetic system protein C